jgi:hypothetical protein
MVGFWDAGSPRGIERILKAANPESLPIGHMTRLDVCVNLKAAQALGIEIPPSIFARGQGLSSEIPNGRYVERRPSPRGREASVDWDQHEGPLGFRLVRV